MEQAVIETKVATSRRPILAEGELYAGILLGKDGVPDQHIILLPGEADDLEWGEAMDWAKSIGGELPTRREQHLLIANLKEEFKPDWYWSGEQHASGSDYAWGQNFSNGYQFNYRKGSELRARAVRRLIIE